jgi:hypothetical protein
VVESRDELDELVATKGHDERNELVVAKGQVAASPSQNILQSLQKWKDILEL